MLTHKDIWRAIDLLAESHGLSTSGLAKKAGLDPTTFNVSKRKSDTGKLRWPSTESLAKALETTGADIDVLADLVHGRGANDSHNSATARRIPIIGCAQAGQNGFFDDSGFPVGSGWDAIDFPRIKDDGVYALEVSGDSMEPLYRDGDILVVSPNAASLRRGDRVVVKRSNGEVMAKQLGRETAEQVTLGSLNPNHADLTLSRTEIDWIARIVWVSQ